MRICHRMCFLSVRSCAFAFLWRIRIGCFSSHFLSVDEFHEQHVKVMRRIEIWKSVVLPPRCNQTKCMDSTTSNTQNMRLSEWVSDWVYRTRIQYGMKSEINNSKWLQIKLLSLYLCRWNNYYHANAIVMCMHVMVSSTRVLRCFCFYFVAVHS